MGDPSRQRLGDLRYLEALAALRAGDLLDAFRIRLLVASFHHVPPNFVPSPFR